MFLFYVSLSIYTYLSIISSLMVRQVTSKSLPFLEAPAKLDGSLVGDVGFDPIGISDQLADLKYVRAAELKHGRFAMLAFLG